MILRGVKVNNLKNINLDIPKYKFVVVTGVSGSGKSSLVFDTVYAEGQRRYVESLSSYARQFLEKMDKPDVDVIDGLAPSMAIEQKTGGRNSRSTVGTSTEIYDYLRLLYARIGEIYSPVSNTPVTKDSPESIIEFLNKFTGSKIYIYVSCVFKFDDEFFGLIAKIRKKGFYKIIIGDELFDINDSEEPELLDKIKEAPNHHLSLDFMIDRLSLKEIDDETKSRLYDALEMGLREGNGYINILIDDGRKKTSYAFNRFLEKDGIKFEEPEPRLFSFNNPYGACKKCQGFSKTIDIDFDLVIPDKTKSIINGAIMPFTTPKLSAYGRDLMSEAEDYNVSIYKPIKDFTKSEYQYLLNGGKKYIGLKKFFKMLEYEASYKLHYRVLLNRYRAYTTCSECGGSRLRKEALYVKINGKSIDEIVNMKIGESYEFFRKLKLTEYQKKVSERILEEIISRLKFLIDVGLDYLTLDRISFTLSGGEAQRINLSTSLGSSLVGSIYVLDEPTIGLHPADNYKLINIIKSLSEAGNTVLVVEHDKDMMTEADQIIDLGPFAGEHGGEVVFQGTYKEILKDKNSLTGKYLSGEEIIPLPKVRRPVNKSTKYIKLKGASENNLKYIDVDIPLKRFVCITGVSGSGKSTLLNSILYPALVKILDGHTNLQIGKYEKLEGTDNINFVELIDQNSIGRTARSNPITYIKAFDEIRELFAKTPAAKAKGITMGDFSFNIPGGRCEVCEGTGSMKIEMQFMADIYLQCEACGGKRYKPNILEIKARGADGTHKNIADVLDMTVTEAMAFFKNEKKVINKLRYLDDVGLGYIKLGQAGSTLSGGEAQRVKLAYYLAFQESYENTLFIFDEPTTGLHMYDISKLLKCFDALIAKNNSLLVIEHNLDVIKCADYIFDLGPGSGDMGGNIVAQGTPEVIAASKKSITGKYLKPYLKEK
ncbi:MAG TPA: excinuclease ABC subunit UvrA [Ignavibacteria bacterium]|nr:excinuclease ABC subunit UvrA [Ignavibacteria bacterium]